MRISCPCRAHGPESGAIIATRASLACAAAGRNPKAMAPAAANPEPNSRRVVPFFIDIASLSYGVRDPIHPAPAEVSFNDTAVADDFVRPPGSNQSAMVEDAKLVDQLNHRLHRMLDDQ